MAESSNYLDTEWLCPDCNGSLTTSGGFIVCKECGLTISRQYVSPTYQMTDNVHQENHDAEMFVSLGNRLHIVDGLGSYIGFHKTFRFRDFHGRTLSSLSQKRFKRLKSIYSTRVRISHDESRYRALRTLNRVSKMLMLSNSVRNRAAYVYKKITNSSIKTNNNILLMAVSLLISVREFKEDAPITLEEIAQAFEQCGHRVSIRAIVREALRLKSITGFAPEIRNPKDYVPRVSSMIINDTQIMKRIISRGWNITDYQKKLNKVTLQIIKSIPPPLRGGRNPFIFAVSAVYAADKLISLKFSVKPSLTQKVVSKATGVAEYSIRDHYGLIKKASLQITI